MNSDTLVTTEIKRREYRTQYIDNIIYGWGGEKTEESAAE